MRRVGAARDVIDKERLVGRDLLELLHVLDGLVGHGRREIPAGIALEGIDRGRVAIEVRLPLAGVAADEAVEILEAHSDRPLVERPGLGRLIGGRVVVLAEPRGRVSVLLQNGADGAVRFQNDRVVARIARGDFAHDPEAGDVVIAARDQGRPRRRAQRGRVEVRVAQPGRWRCDPEPGSGSTPPKVPGAPKPSSSVMMSSTLGAPFGGTTRGAHQGVDSEALSLITPPNVGSGGGSCFPSIVMVAPGEPRVPLISSPTQDERQ